MSCESFTETLDDYADGALSHVLHTAVSAHLAQCDRCSAELARHRRYLQVVRKMPVPEPAPGQLAHLLRRTAMRGEELQRQVAPGHAFLRGFATASLLAVVSIVGYWQYGLDEDPAPVEMTTISEHALTREVTVVINVPADMPAANLALEFPASLRLEGLEDLRRVAWQIDLEQGANVLTLPVTVAAGTNLAEPLSILATVSYGNQEKRFQLPVELLVAGSLQQEGWRKPSDQHVYDSKETWRS